MMIKAIKVDKKSTIKKVNVPNSDNRVWSVLLLVLLAFAIYGLLQLNDAVYFDCCQLFG